MSYPKKAWPGPARQSIFGYDNDKDLKTHFLVTPLISKLNIESLNHLTRDTFAIRVRLVGAGVPTFTLRSASTPFCSWVAGAALTYCKEVARK